MRIITIWMVSDDNHTDEQKTWKGIIELTHQRESQFMTSEKHNSKVHASTQHLLTTPKEKNNISGKWMSQLAIFEGTRKARPENWNVNDYFSSAWVLTADCNKGFGQNNNIKKQKQAAGEATEIMQNWYSRVLEKTIDPENIGQRESVKTSGQDPNQNIKQPKNVEKIFSVNRTKSQLFTNRINFHAFLFIIRA